MILIEDPSDPRIAGFAIGDRRLRHAGSGRDAGRFLAEGDLVVERALAAGCRPIAVLVDPDRVPAVAGRLGVDVFAAGADVRRAVTGMGRVQPVVALFARPVPLAVADVTSVATRLVVVEAVDNPANVGAIVRNAVAMGWDGLVLDATSADPLARRALRVAMGTAFVLPHARTDDIVAVLAGLRRDGVTTCALTPDGGAVDIATVTPRGRCAIVVGSERDGLTAATLEACTDRVRIPLAPGVDSLNVAAATAIACHVLRRQR